MGKLSMILKKRVQKSQKMIRILIWIHQDTGKPTMAMICLRKLMKILMMKYCKAWQQPPGIKSRLDAIRIGHKANSNKKEHKGKMMGEEEKACKFMGN